MRYTRLADICDDLNRARAAKDGSYFEKMDAYKSVALLLVDDFMMIIAGRLPRRSTLSCHTVPRRAASC